MPVREKEPPETGCWSPRSTPSKTDEKKGARRDVSGGRSKTNGHAAPRRLCVLGDPAAWREETPDGREDEGQGPAPGVRATSARNHYPCMEGFLLCGGRPVSQFKEGVRGTLATAGVLRIPAVRGAELAAPSPAQVSLRSAAVMSAILAFAALFTVFLPQWAVRTISADAWDFLYSLAVFLGGEFFTGLVAILGLAQYARG